MNNGFPTDQEIMNRTILPRSHEFYSDQPDLYNSILADFIGVLIMSLEEDKKTELNLKELYDMRDRFNHD